MRAHDTFLAGGGVRISAIDATGEESDPTSHIVHTYGKEFSCGHFELDRRSPEGMEFAGERAVKTRARGREGTAGDLAFAHALGSEQTFFLSAPHGIERCDPDSFGDGSAAPGSDSGKIHQCDSGSPETMSFRLRTKDGRDAFIRVVDVSQRTVRFEYLLGPKR